MNLPSLQRQESRNLAERRSPTRLVCLFATAFALACVTATIAFAADASLPFVGPMFGDNMVPATRRADSTI